MYEEAILGKMKITLDKQKQILNRVKGDINSIQGKIMVDLLLSEVHNGL